MVEFNLSIKQKSKLIEILLIVGALLAALELPKNLIWIFMLFVILAIFYYIFIQKNPKESMYFSIIVLTLSICFSAIVAYELGFSLGLNLGSTYNFVTITITTVYIIFITWGLYNALRVGRMIHFINKESPKRKKSNIESLWDKNPAFVRYKNEKIKETYTCKNCGYELKKNEKPCPKCGCQSRAISISLFDKIGISDRIKLHLKSGEKREDGKPKKEIISKIKNGEERSIIKDRRNEKTQATFIVWRDGKLHHIHDKTSGQIEIWHKENDIYWDKEGNLYTKTTLKNNKSIEVFVDSEGKEYRFLTR